MITKQVYHNIKLYRYKTVAGIKVCVEGTGIPSGDQPVLLGDNRTILYQTQVKAVKDENVLLCHVVFVISSYIGLCVSFSCSVWFM